MSSTMKAVMISKPGEVRLVETAIPEPPVGFARVKVKAAAICATDLEVIDGRIPANYPLIPGHEWSGIVDAVGSDEDRHWIGQSVIGSNDVVCLKCDACRSGNWRYCDEFEESASAGTVLMRNISLYRFTACAECRSVFPMPMQPCVNPWVWRWVPWRRPEPNSAIP